METGEVWIDENDELIALTLSPTQCHSHHFCLCDENGHVFCCHCRFTLLVAPNYGIGGEFFVVED